MSAGPKGHSRFYRNHLATSGWRRPDPWGSHPEICAHFLRREESSPRVSPILVLQKSPTWRLLPYAWINPLNLSKEAPDVPFQNGASCGMGEEGANFIFLEDDTWRASLDEKVRDRV